MFGQETLYWNLLNLGNSPLLNLGTAQTLRDRTLALKQQEGRFQKCCVRAVDLTSVQSSARNPRTSPPQHSPLHLWLQPFRSERIVELKRVDSGFLASDHGGCHKYFLFFDWKEETQRVRILSGACVLSFRGWGNLFPDFMVQKKKTCKGAILLGLCVVECGCPEHYHRLSGEPISPISFGRT